MLLFIINTVMFIYNIGICYLEDRREFTSIKLIANIIC